MRRRGVLGALLLAGLMTAGPVGADERAEVRTWGGQSWRLSDLSLDVYYSIVPAVEEGAGAATGGSMSEAASIVGGTGQSRATTTRLFGSAEDLGSLLGKRVAAVQGQRQTTSITLSRDGVETRIPVEKIASLLFFRQPIWNSTLPPYVASGHYRYSATAVLTDGSRVEGDYVNLGTLRLRGTTEHGRVDVAWEDLELVRFER